MSLNKTFAALSDATRRDILKRLTQGATRVTELAEPYKMSLPAISKHLKVLESAGLILRVRKGREHHIEIDAEPLEEVQVWLAHYAKFWDQQFDQLDAFLQASDPKTKANKRKDNK